MKKDKLEHLFSENRDAFDDKTPSDNVWRRIENALFGDRTVSLWSSVMVWRAAAILLAGFSVFLLVERSGNKNGVTANRAVTQEFTDIELYYSTQISEKVALISSEGLFADDSFTQDLQKLEAMYSVMADEMKKHPSEKVKDALVLNMLVRIDLLNQQIQRLEESKRKKDTTSTI